MPRNSPFDQGDNELLEFGISTVKAVPSQIAKALNPLSGVFEKKTTDSSPSKDTGVEKLMQNNTKPKSTDLNLKELEAKYANQDKMKIEAMKNKLFHMVKSDEEKAILERKKEKEQRKQMELQEEHDKKQKQLYLQNQQTADLPQGKVRKQIGATAKKVVSDTRQEMKGNKGSG
jgi:hypothetical protein